MKLISWNVNGLRACVNKGFLDIFTQLDGDIFCIQESKLQEGQIELELPGYYQYWNYAKKKVTPARRCLRERNLWRFLMESGWRSMIRKGVSLRWNMKNTTWSRSIHQILRANWHGLPIEWSGRMPFELSLSSQRE